MKQRDKNIFIIIVFIIIALLLWTLNSYNSTKKTLENERELDLKQKQDADTNLKQQFNKVKKNNLIPIISISELDKKIFTDNTLVMVDARSANSFRNGHIKNSLHISEFDTDKQRRTVVFITPQGDESILTKYFRATSDTNKVYNLEGGFEAWKKSGHPIVALNIKHTFENQAKVQFIEPRDLNKLLLKKTSPEFIIVDTRRPGNYKKEHISTAINIPFNELERRYKEIPIAKKIYVYGIDENASFDAGVLLHDLGFIGTKTINGGFRAWTGYGYPITTK